MRRSYKFLLRPTSKQAAALAQCLEDHRVLYNAALEHRRTAYRKAGVTVRYGDPKAESAGREVIAVEPRNTSRTCARCGHCAAENRVTQAEFACTACGHAAHADVNAAVNIFRAGLVLREVAEAA